MEAQKALEETIDLLTKLKGSVTFRWRQLDAQIIELEKQINSLIVVKNELYIERSEYNEKKQGTRQGRTEDESGA